MTRGMLAKRVLAYVGVTVLLALSADHLVGMRAQPAPVDRAGRLDDAMLRRVNALEQRVQALERAQGCEDE